MQWGVTFLWGEGDRQLKRTEKKLESTPLLPLAGSSQKIILNFIYLYDII